MKEFNILSLYNNEYSALITMCISESPLNYLLDIEEELKEKKLYGNMIIDQILHSGNNEERFLTFYFDKDVNKQLILKFVSIPKTTNVRRIACENLMNLDLLNYSILSSIQRRMIEKGIVI